MNTFGTIKAKDYTVEKFYSNSPIGWELVSSSNGTIVATPPELLGAVTITNAINDSTIEETNIETGVNKYIQYRSIKHMFYNRMMFFDGTILTTASLSSLKDKSYVVSVGQYFYGERIQPGTFELSIDSIVEKVKDDGLGNLYVSQSATGSYVGNIFYNYGIAVITENSGSVGSAISSSGIKIVNGSDVYVDYSAEYKINRHQINVKLESSDFNYSIFNPSMTRAFSTTGSVTQSFVDANIPTSGSNTWKLFDLMGAGIVKPYVTSVGLYNDKYEMLAVAKLSTPIQRTFDMEQIFIVRFDT